MKIGIDATNLNMGGGKTHIVNFLNAINWKEFHDDEILLYAKNTLFDLVNDSPHIVKKTNRYINGNILMRYYWFFLKSKNDFADIDVLFAPGGLYFGDFHPFISMSRNMLLFDIKERKRVGIKLRIKLELSRYFQIKSFKLADGIIFLSDYAKKTISKELNLDNKYIKKIPHGVASRFRYSPENRNFSQKETFNLLYISHIYEYKHPWNIVYATAILKNKGYNINLKIVGGGDPIAILKLNNIIEKISDSSFYIEYCGITTHDKIDSYYKDADIFVYASTCENMPNILIEAMSSSLPIACSNYPPMPEFIRDSGVLFDPLNVNDIVNAIEKLISSSELRESLSSKSFKYSLKYDWMFTARKTMNFIHSVCDEYKKNNNYVII